MLSTPPVTTVMAPTNKASTSELVTASHCPVVSGTRRTFHNGTNNSPLART